LEEAIMAHDKPELISLYRQDSQKSLDLQSRFTFRCHNGLACFNQCCRTPTVILSPYDILRLKQGLGITSEEFLQRYTRQEIEANSNLPLIFLDPFRSSDPACPFLGAEGCQVYALRPTACRLFPITMGSQLTEQGVVDHYFCRRLDYCQGFDTEVTWTVESWQANQGFVEYDKNRRPWLELLLKVGLLQPQAVDDQMQDLVATIAYDLDTFRRLLVSPTFLRTCDLAAPTVEHLLKDDQALLSFSYRYLQSFLQVEQA
jgi:uncharacterized protein